MASHTAVNCPMLLQFVSCDDSAIYQNKSPDFQWSIYWLIDMNMLV